MPGSPPTRTREPFTIPPPSTLSSSEIPVVTRSSLSNDTSFILIGKEAAMPGFRLLPPFFRAGASEKAFQALQAGHWPSHLADS